MKKGTKLSEEHRKKLCGPRPSTSGEKNHQWKGDKVGYAGVHIWIRKTLGTPSTCEGCGKSGLMGKKIHWANKSGGYLREVTDWMRLCVSCHRKHDLSVSSLAGLDQTGRTPWNKGKKGVQEYTKERNKKVSESLKRMGHNPQKFAKGL